MTKKVGVLGAGQMGNGIAHVAAQAGLGVVMRDLAPELPDRGLATIAKNLQRGEVLHEGLGEDKYRPCPLLRKHVEAGWLGRKSGRGFHDDAAART